MSITRSVSDDLSGKAPLASPSFTGTPASTTASVDTNTTQIATTAYVIGQAASATSPINGTAATGTSLKYARQDHVHGSDTSRAPLASPTFTGVPLSTTAAADTNTTQIATTAYVIGQGYAKLASPTLTGTPLSTTAAADTNTTQVATTAFVVGQGYLKSTSASTTYAPLASPTLTGVPAAPTATLGTNTTQIATTAFVKAETAALVDSAPATLDTLNELAAALGDDANFSTTVTNTLANKLDISSASSIYITQVSASTIYAPLASPTLTGTPAAPTAAVGTNTTQLATTAFVKNSANTVVIDTKTDSYTLLLADAGETLEMNSASANTVTIPLNSSVAFPIGTTLDIIQYGAGQTTIVATGGVTLRSKGAALKLTGQYSGATLYKRGTDEWVIIGDLTV